MITLANGENCRIGHIQRYADGRIHVDADECFLPGASGWHHEIALPEALRDALPDSFSMKVLTLAYGKRLESELAALLLGSNRYRLGVLRLFDESGALIGSHENELTSSKSLPVMMQCLRDVMRVKPIPDYAIMRFLVGVSGSFLTSHLFQMKKMFMTSASSLFR